MIYFLEAIFNNYIIFRKFLLYFYYILFINIFKLNLSNYPIIKSNDLLKSILFTIKLSIIFNKLNKLS
jgi:hypothetical protein